MPFKKTKHLVFSRYLSLLCLLLFLVVASVFVAVSLGAVTIDIGDTYGVIFSKLGLPIASHNIAKPLEAIIWNMRVPRVLLGLIVVQAFPCRGVLCSQLSIIRLPSPTF